MVGKSEAEFDVQENASIAAAFAVMRQDPNIPKELMSRLSGVLETEMTGEGVKIIPTGVKKVQHDVMTESLEQYDVVALKGVDRYYKRPMVDGTPVDDVYQPTDKEELVNIITSNYQKITGTVDGAAIDKIWNSVDKKIRMEKSIEKVDNTLIQLIPDNFGTLRLAMCMTKYLMAVDVLGDYSIHLKRLSI